MLNGENWNSYTYINEYVNIIELIFIDRIFRLDEASGAVDTTSMQ